MLCWLLRVERTLIELWISCCLFSCRQPFFFDDVIFWFRVPTRDSSDDGRRTHTMTDDRWRGYLTTITIISPALSTRISANSITPRLEHRLTAGYVRCEFPFLTLRTWLTIAPIHLYPRRSSRARDTASSSFTLCTNNESNSTRACISLHICYRKLQVKSECKVWQCYFDVCTCTWSLLGTVPMYEIELPPTRHKVSDNVEPPPPYSTFNFQSYRFYIPSSIPMVLSSLSINNITSLLARLWS